MGDENVKSTKCEQTNGTVNNDTEKIPKITQITAGDGNTRTTDSSENVMNDVETTSDTFNNVHNTPTTQTEKESVSKNGHEVIDESCANRFLTLKIESDEMETEPKKQQVHETDEQKNDNYVHNIEVISELASNELYIENESQSNDDSRNTSCATKNINDVHLTFVDQDDGISKSVVSLVKKAYGGVKKKLAKSPVRRSMSPRNEVSLNASGATAQFLKKENGFSVDDDCYDFSHHQRGYMVLVVNNQFDGFSPRDGAICDLRKMKEIGKNLGFSELRYRMKDMNLTKLELMSVLLDVQRADHSDCDCLLLMISSHGLENANALKAGKTDHALVCADDQLIFTSTITEMFNDSNCPSLKGKPKIFFIQACRGDSVDDGETISVAHPKSEDRTCGVTSTGNVHNGSESVDVSDTRYGDDSWVTHQSNAHSQAVYKEARSSRVSPQFYVQNVSSPSSKHEAVQWASSRTIQKIYAPTHYDTPSLKCDNDMLVMYAIPPGMFAWRNTSEGSWMIDYLHRVLMAHDLRKPKSFLNLLTQVNARMSRRATNTRYVPGTHGKTATSFSAVCECLGVGVVVLRACACRGVCVRVCVTLIYCL